MGFVDFYHKKRCATTSAISCNRAQLSATERKFKKCAFWNHTCALQRHALVHIVLKVEAADMYSILCVAVATLNGFS